jgi:hypothetical protein
MDSALIKKYLQVTGIIRTPYAGHNFFKSLVKQIKFKKSAVIIAVELSCLHTSVSFAEYE